MDEFYEIARNHCPTRTVLAGAPSEAKARAREHADEIVGTIHEVSDFRAWATRISGRAAGLRAARMMGEGAMI